MKVYTAVRKCLAHLLHPLGHLLAFYPLLFLVVVGLWALVWGQVLTEYDAFHQIWHDKWWVGIANGALVAFILGIVTMSVRLTSRPTQSGKKAPDSQKSPASLLSFHVSWWLLLLLFAVPIVRAEPGAAAAERLDYSADWRRWFPLGFVLAMFVDAVLVWVSTRTPKSAPTVGGQPRGRFVRLCTNSAPRLVLCALTAGYLAMVVIHASFTNVYCPIFPASVSFLLYFSLFTALLGGLTFLARNRWWGLYPAMVGIIGFVVLFPSKQVENQVPHMTIGKSAKDSYYDRRAVLANYDELRQGDGGGLVDDRKALEAWDKAMLREFGSPQPLVIVACSGGASASALYTADVLYNYEEQHPGFSKRIRLISGASGGMLGAAYFVSQLRPGGAISQAQATDEYREYLTARRKGTPATDPSFQVTRAAYMKVMEKCRKEFFAGLEADFLGPLVQKWVHKDVPLSPFGFLGGLIPWFGQTTNDRGAALEEAWARHQNRALDVPFRDLREDEAAGTLPSLVFSPMMIEDGRLLFISNLNLDYMVETGQNDTYPDHDKRLRSYIGAEFYKLFPQAHQFRLSTAVRMNAAFPFFSPAAALPTDPVRHVVDAGYYDNYGMVVATKWLLRKKIADYLKGPYATARTASGTNPEVLFLRIRCFGNQHTPRMLPTEAELDKHARHHLGPRKLRDEWVKWKSEDGTKPPVRTEGGLFTLTAPLIGALAARRANMVYRADERLEAGFQEYSEKPNEVRVEEYPLDCSVEPSLNWVLTKRDIQRIHEDVRGDVGKLNEGANQRPSRFVVPMIAVPPPVPNITKVGQPPVSNRSEFQMQAKVANELVTAQFVRKQVKRIEPADGTLTPTLQYSLQKKAELASKLSQLPVPKPPDPNVPAPKK